MLALSKPRLLLTEFPISELLDNNLPRLLLKVPESLDICEISKVESTPSVEVGVMDPRPDDVTDKGLLGRNGEGDSRLSVCT